MKNLYGALLGYLRHALDKLLALHSVYLLHKREVLRRESRYAPEPKRLIRAAQGVAYGENPRVKKAYDVAGESLVDDFPALCHKVLRL